VCVCVCVCERERDIKYICTETPYTAREKWTGLQET
jgi:hypothetical protein